MFTKKSPKESEKAQKEECNYAHEAPMTENEIKDRETELEIAGLRSDNIGLSRQVSYLEGRVRGLEFSIEKYTA